MKPGQSLLSYCMIIHQHPGAQGSRIYCPQKSHFQNPGYAPVCVNVFIGFKNKIRNLYVTYQYRYITEILTQHINK